MESKDKLPSAAPPNHVLVQLLAAALLHPESAEGNIRQVIESLSAAPVVGEHDLISRAAAKAAMCNMCANPDRYKPAEPLEGSMRLFHFQRSDNWNAGQCLAQPINALPAAATAAPQSLPPLPTLYAMFEEWRTSFPEGQQPESGAPQTEQLIDAWIAGFAKHNEITCAASVGQSDDDWVAWLCYDFTNEETTGTTINVCDSDAEGAFKVYRSPQKPSSTSARAAAEEIYALQKRYGHQTDDSVWMPTEFELAGIIERHCFPSRIKP